MIRVVSAACVVLASGLILTACLPSIPVSFPITNSSPTSGPVQPPTLQTLPTATITIVPSPSPTLIPTGTFTPIPSLTPTLGITDTPVMASSTATLGNTQIAAPSNLTGDLVTDTATPFGAPGNLNVIYGPFHIRNRSHDQVDLSFHCTTSKGDEIIIEFSNVRNVVTTMPLGNYSYVMFQGGRQSIGSFSYLVVRKLSFTIYKDGVVIQ